MAKALIIDGKVYRYRRGKLVQVPPEWVGKITSKETIRQRPSKMSRKVRRSTKYINGHFNYIDNKQKPFNPFEYE